MLKAMKRLALSSALLWLGAIDAEACSRVFLHEGPSTTFVARSMDLFFPDQGRLTVYPRGIRRGGSGENMLRWISRYGSVAINSLGIVSTDGINEKGLNANLLYLDDTEYETRDRRPGVPYNLWVQYLLDNFSTVDEALKAMNEVQIVPLKILGHQWPIHISLADRAGDTAIVEFVRGKMFVYRGAGSAVMTNEPPLPEQLANLQNYRPFGGARPVPGNFDPVSRFVRLSVELKETQRPQSMSQAKMTMTRMIGSVTVPMNASFIKGLPTFKDWILQYFSSEEWPTLWVSQADLAHGVYSVQSTRNGNSLWLDLSEIDFSEGREAMDVDIDDKNASGDATRFLRPAKPPFNP